MYKLNGVPPANNNAISMHVHVCFLYIEINYHILRTDSWFDIMFCIMQIRSLLFYITSNILFCISFNSIIIKKLIKPYTNSHELFDSVKVFILPCGYVRRESWLYIYIVLLLGFLNLILMINDMLSHITCYHMTFFLLNQFYILFNLDENSFLYIVNDVYIREVMARPDQKLYIGNIKLTASGPRLSASRIYN